MKFIKTKMKRLALRLAALGLVVSTGAVAIVQIKHAGKPEAVADDAATAAKTGKPRLDDLRTTPDPFAANRLRPRPAADESLADNRELLSRPQMNPRNDVEQPRRNPLRDNDPLADSMPRRAPQDNPAPQPKVNDPFGLRAERPNDYPVKRVSNEVPAQPAAERTVERPALDPLAEDNLGPAPRRMPDAQSSAAPLPQAGTGTNPPAQSAIPTNPEYPPLNAGSTRIEVQNAADDLQNRGAPATLPSAASAGMSKLPPPRSPYDPGDAANSSGEGRPGARQLEGAQSPQLQVEKIAPPEVQVGKPAIFKTKVKNVGQVTAQGVEIHDEIPHGAQLIKTTPPIQPGPRGELIWSIGALKPNEETTVQVEVTPTAEGEIGSVASVQFRSEASSRSVVTKPALAMQLSAPKQAMIGTDVTLSIKLSNPGTGAATGVVLEEKVPANFKHVAGSELEFDVGTLKPGETRQLDLTMSAVKAGKVLNTISAHGEGSLKTEQQVDIEVIAPGLEVGMNGPTRRYLERQATYTVSVTNPGTAPAKDIQLVTHLPRGLKFVKANNSGQYDAASHSVQWNLEELPASETGNVTLVTMPIEQGEQKLTIDGKAKQGLVDHKEQTVIVDGLAAVMFEVTDTDDPVEVGQPTTYEIRVVNQGTKPATNIQLLGVVPAEAKPLSAEGPTRFAIAGQQVTFEPLARLAPKADVTFKVKVQALAAGDLRFKVQLLSDESRTPITKEESTRVFSDQ